MAKKRSKVKRLLSIDGGGIRGIIPALVLAEMEMQTNKPVCEHFDLIAGTSTGGILALGLTVPNSKGKPRYKARDLVALYEANGHHIFSRTIWHRIHSGWGLREEKYPAEPLEGILKDYFGDARLDASLTEVFVTAYAIERRCPFFFRSVRAKKKSEYGESYNFLMREAARATSAAPTYFEPYQLQSLDEENDYYALVDGGVFANNPAMCAYADARILWPGDKLILVSLGTGELTRSLPIQEARTWGLAEWIKPVMDVVFDGVSDSVNYQIKQLLGNNYLRLQTRLVTGNDDMDDASETNVRALKLLGKELIRDKKAEIEMICKKLNT
jgi:patatin-like phospholipase/acyl hydrolase